MFCIPIIASDTDRAEEKISRAVTLADMLELRLDLMNHFDLPGLVRVSNKPVLVTYRSISEGGKGSDDPQKAGRILLEAFEAGADLVDMELRLPAEWRHRIMERKGHSKVVVSSHFFQETPSRKELNRIFRKSVDTGGDVVKIVTMAEEWADILRVLDLIPTAQKEGIEIVAFCMGPIGRISRVLSHLLGSYLTFTSLETGQESAAGQIPAAEMMALIRMFSHQDSKSQTGNQ